MYDQRRLVILYIVEVIRLISTQDIRDKEVINIYDGRSMAL